MTDKTDSKERHALREAERLLRRDAESLREGHTSHANREDWTGEEEAKVGYDEYISAADALAALDGRDSFAIGFPEGVSRDDTVHGRTYYTAENMAWASAKGFREGVASLAASAGSEPVAKERFSEPLSRVVYAGYLLANCAFNLAQRPGEVLTPATTETLSNCRKEWDDACAAFKAHPSPPEGAGWRPASEAPQGQLMLFCDMNASELRASFFVDWMVDGTFCGNRHHKATHCRPLPPAPPASEAKGA